MMMRMTHLRQLSRRRQRSGFTLIELMIAMVVLTVGLLALMGLLATAIRSNGRNKVDSTATMLAQTVLEQINSSMLDYSDDDPSVTDDSGTEWHIYTSADAGAALRTSDGYIDFTEASPPAGYHMKYVIKSIDPNSGAESKATYDVRWRIQTVTEGTYLITVGAVLAGAPAPTRDLRMFAFPSNLKLLVGSNTI
jgi:type IV pilus modification protein PilV